MTKLFTNRSVLTTLCAIAFAVCISFSAAAATPSECTDTTACKLKVLDILYNHVAVVDNRMQLDLDEATAAAYQLPAKYWQMIARQINDNNRCIQKDPIFRQIDLADAMNKAKEEYLQLLQEFKASGESFDAFARKHPHSIFDFSLEANE